MSAVPISLTDVEFGKQLWQVLRRSKKFPTCGVLWLFQSAFNEWRLLIASPRVDEVGPRQAYGELSRTTKTVRASEDQFLRLVLISPKAPFYQALRSVFGKTASVEGARLGNTQIGGMYIDDAYLYEIR
ncbi:MAG: hypothetical protein WCF26_20710 [Candidatus Sulfotelmatobacter sp.]